MFDYLTPHNGPVIRGLEHCEIVYAQDQPEYVPLRTLQSSGEMGEVVSRWTLTPEQRKAVAEGADIFLELSTFHQPLQPIRICIGDGSMDCPLEAVFRYKTAVEEYDARMAHELGISISSLSLPIMKEDVENK